MYNYMFAITGTLAGNIFFIHFFPAHPANIYFRSTCMHFFIFFQYFILRSSSVFVFYSFPSFINVNVGKQDRFRFTTSLFMNMRGDICAVKYYS